MTLPEDAPDRARAEAERKRAAGGYAGDEPGGPLDDSIAEASPSPETLAEWAVIHVDAGTLYSTRRGGAPVTALKRLLLRLLRQYLVEAEAHQTRFNLAVVKSLQELERRVERLESVSKRDE